MSATVKRALELAERTVQDITNLRVGTVEASGRRLFEESASRGISGGPQGNAMIEIGVEEIRERAKSTTDAIKRGATSVGLNYAHGLADELRAGFDRLFAEQVRIVGSQTAFLVKNLPFPKPGLLETSAVNAIEQRSSIEKRAAGTEIVHFVETLRTSKRENRASLLRGLLLGGVGGAILKAAFDQILGFVHHH